MFLTLCLYVTYYIIDIFFYTCLFPLSHPLSAGAAFGDVFSVIGVREPQAAASEAFVKFAEAHRNIEKYGIQLLKTIKPVRNSYISCDPPPGYLFITDIRGSGHLQQHVLNAVCVVLSSFVTITITLSLITFL